MKRKLLVGYLVIFLFSSYCALVNLDNTVFWDDEAFVGLISRNYLKTGLLSGWSGRNLYGYANGTALDQSLRSINPPLDVLTMAGSFSLLGVSTWAGRLPFVLAGLLALALFGAIVYREWKHRPEVQLYAFGSLAMSVVFLLTIRTGRYYALALLFSLGCYFAYQSTLINQRRRHFLLLALCAAALFYSHYLICVTFLLALAAMHFAYYRREWSRAQWLHCLVAVAGFLALTVPYAIFFRIWHRPDLAASSVPWLQRKMILLNLNFAGLFEGALLPLAVFVGTVLLLAVKPLRARFAAYSTALGAWLLLIATYTFLQAMLSAMPVHGPYGIAELRYYLPVLPFAAGLTGLCLGALHQYSKTAAALLFACLISSTLLTVSPLGGEFRWLLPAYLREVHAPYPTSASETVKFLNRHARQDDVVRIVRHHHNYPVMFYMDEKVRFGALLDDQTPQSPAVINRLGKFLWSDQTFPDWLIFYAKSDLSRDWLKYFSRPVLQDEKWVSYSYQQVKMLDVFFNQTQRPELPWHAFGPLTGYDRAKEAVYIYRRSGPVPATRPAPGTMVKAPSMRD